MIKVLLSSCLFITFLGLGSAQAAASSDDYYQAGNKLYTQGNYDLCIRYYQAAIQTDPNNWKAYQALGSCQYHLGQKDAALANFNKSLAINPNNPGLQTFVNRISGNAAAGTAGAPSLDRRLPSAGSLCWNIGLAASSYGDGDLVNDYAPLTLTQPSQSPVGVELDLGGDYCLSQSFELGLQFQYLSKQPEILSSTYTALYSGVTVTIASATTYTESCGGAALNAKYLLPLGDDLRLALNGQCGFYSLIGTTISTTETYYNNSSVDVSGTGVGGYLGVEFEWMLQPQAFGLDFGLGYRALSFGTLTASASGYSGTTTITNGKNDNATFDFSGLRFYAGARFF